MARRDHQAAARRRRREIIRRQAVDDIGGTILALIGLWCSSQLAYAQGRAYVANFGSNSVSVIDTSSNTVIYTIAVGTQPNGIAITPDGTRAYVANGGGDVWVLATSNNAVRSPGLVARPPTKRALRTSGPLKKRVLRAARAVCDVTASRTMAV